MQSHMHLVLAIWTGVHAELMSVSLLELWPASPMKAKSTPQSC